MNNPVYEFKCKDIGEKGESIGTIKNEDIVVFANNFIPGESGIINISQKKKNYWTGNFLKLINKSKYRIIPKCKYFNQCGGCQLQHIKYNYQLELKKKSVINKLQRIANINISYLNNITIEKSDNIFNYRNKNKYPVKKINKQIEIGFYKINSHKLINIDTCLISKENSKKIFEKIKHLIIKNKISVYDENNKKGIIRFLTIRSNKYNEYYVGLVVSKFNNKQIEFIKKELINIDTVIKFDAIINNTTGNKILTNKIINIFTKKDFYDYLGKYKFKIGINDFFQINNDITLKLYNDIIKYGKFNKDNIIIDIFSGIGTITIYIAGFVKRVIGLEILKSSTEISKFNSKINKIKNVDFFTTDANTNFKTYFDEFNPNTIIVDPPRKGLSKELIEYIINSPVNKICYISCNPATLARDIALLSNNFKIKFLKLYDMFPQTIHVETLCIMERR